MAFDCHSSVPIDTHIWTIVQKRYAKGAKIRPSKSKSLSKATYDDISSHLRGLWGEYAGWAQSVCLLHVRYRPYSSLARSIGFIYIRITENALDYNMIQMEELSDSQVKFVYKYYLLRPSI
jgi:hypothetical protein